MPTPTVINKFRYSDVINRRYWDNSYYFNSCSSNPNITKLGGGAAAGAGAEVDIVSGPGVPLEQFIIVGDTTLGPQIDSTGYGLNLASVATSTHGRQYDPGITAVSPFQFVIDTTGNTTPAFFMKANFKLATAAGLTECIIGFRKLAARNATYTSYTDFASIGTLAGEFETVTNIASGGAITTDLLSAAADATPYTVEIYVDSFGNVTYAVNGLIPSAAVKYQFANGTILIPFISIVQNATLSAYAASNYLEWGFQS